MTNTNRVPQQILIQRYNTVAQLWVNGYNVKRIAQTLGVRLEDVYRYKRTKYCRQKIEELGGSFYRQNVGISKKILVAKERCRQASELSHKFKSEGLSNIEILRAIASELELDIATIYLYLKREDWTGVKDLAKKVERKME